MPECAEVEGSLPSERAICCALPDEQKLPDSNCSRLRVSRTLAIGGAMSLSTIARNAAAHAF